MDSAKILHTTCNIDVWHAVVQFFTVVNLSFREPWLRRRLCLFHKWEPSMAGGKSTTLSIEESVSECWRQIFQEVDLLTYNEDINV
uniref:Uncharacterized protein n=1 Tax=Romanomermis culicivorax TaxID=13658 RepID=A0A915KPU2_ROMCU